jgi:hypothetical protein
LHEIVNRRLLLLRSGNPSSWLLGGGLGNGGFPCSRHGGGFFFNVLNFFWVDVGVVRTEGDVFDAGVVVIVVGVVVVVVRSLFSS